MTLSRDELQFRLGWFKEQMGQMDEGRTGLECLASNIMGVRLDAQVWSEYGARLKPAHDALRNAMLTGTGSIAEGEDLMSGLKSSLHSTGKAYLQTEAANSNLSAEVTQMMEREGF